jgi:magnesium chelatase subunit ChlD-like protein
MQVDAGALLDWPATLRARLLEAGPGAGLQPAHLRWRQSLATPQTLHVLALDCSASMLASGALARAKGLVLQWLRWAYLQRMPVALLCFGAGQVQWRLAPGRAPRWNAALIEPLAGGGGTPLAQAVHQAWELLARRAQQQGQPACLWLLSDFRSPDVLALEQQRGPQGLSQVLVDCEPASAKPQFAGAQRLARAWPDAVRLALPE